MDKKRGWKMLHVKLYLGGQMKNVGDSFNMDEFILVVVFFFRKSMLYQIKKYFST